MTSSVRQRLAASPLAPAAALPLRLAAVGRHNARTMRESARWLVRSREHTNYTYELTGLNREHLAWFVADTTGRAVGEIRGYIDELDQDEALRVYVRGRTEASHRRRLADREARWHKRLGWYALVRATRPQHVVETGTDKGLGSLVLAAALLRNGAGRLTTIDVNDSSGYLIGGRYGEVIDRRVGDSVAVLPSLAQVGLFLHDSWHTFEHETAEYEAVAPALAAGALVLSDNAHVTAALPQWAERTGRRFSYWQERPAGHWYPGGGIGVAVGVEALPARAGADHGAEPAGARGDM